MKLIIGDKTQYLADYAKSIDPTAYLLERSNFQNAPGDVAYTSLADLDIQQLLHLTVLENDIEYYPPKKWSSKQLKHLTEKEILRLASWQNIKGIELIESSKETSLALIDDRKTDKKQLWCAGCSITFGCGIDEDLSWPKLVSQNLRLKMSLLSYPGASIRWASDQILRSDIRKNDLVIWGLTSSVRFPCYQSGYTIHALGVDAFRRHEKIRKYYNIDLVIDDDVLINESMIGIQSVINFCNKIGAKLILVGLLSQDIVSYIGNKENYIDINLSPETYIDLGYDGCHPGPKQHEEYTKRILEWIHTQY